MFVVKAVAAVVDKVVPTDGRHPLYRSGVGVGAHQEPGLLSFGVAGIDMGGPAHLGDPHVSGDPVDLFGQLYGVLQLSDKPLVIKPGPVGVDCEHVKVAAGIDGSFYEFRIYEGRGAPQHLQRGIYILDQLVAVPEHQEIVFLVPREKAYVGLVPDLPVPDAVLVAQHGLPDKVVVGGPALVRILRVVVVPVSQQAVDGYAVLQGLVHQLIVVGVVEHALFLLYGAPVELFSGPLDAYIPGQLRCFAYPLPLPAVEIHAHAEGSLVQLGGADAAIGRLPHIESHGGAPVRIGERRSRVPYGGDAAKPHRSLQEGFLAKGDLEGKHIFPAHAGKSDLFLYGADKRAVVIPHVQKQIRLHRLVRQTPGLHRKDSLAVLCFPFGSGGDTLRGLYHGLAHGSAIGLRVMIHYLHQPERGV